MSEDAWSLLGCISRESFTFFISSSSHVSSRQVVTDLSDWLIARGGRWYDDYSWVDGFDDAERMADEKDLERRMRGDIRGAACCDLFVFIDNVYMSRGSNIELGVRLGAERPFVYIGGNSDYLFYRAASECFASVNAFKEA